MESFHSEQTEHLVVVRPGGLGDTVLLAPSLAALQMRRTLRISLVGYTDRLFPLVRSGLAERAFALDTWLYSSRSVLVGSAGTEKLRTEVVSFYPTFPEEVSKETRIRVFPPKPPEESRRHAVVHVAECFGLDSRELPLSPLRRLGEIFGSSEGPGIVGFHPGAGRNSKRWPLPNFLQLASTVQDALQGRVVFLLGECEEENRRDIESVGFPVRCCRDTRSLVGGLSGCELFIGNDSGPSHLAALMGIPTVALFLSTDPNQWRPWGERVLVIHAQRLSEKEVGDLVISFHRATGTGSEDFS